MKKKIRIILDLTMTVLLFFLMGYQFWGERAHEWAGAAMFLCFILHHMQNIGWYRSLGKGVYHANRILLIIADLLLLLAMAGLMISGIMLSRHVFGFLGIRKGTSFARVLHMVSAYWALVLMAFHIGLHLAPMMRMGKRYIKKKSVELALCGIGLLWAAYGLFTFIKRGIYQNMFLQNRFAFLNYGESKLAFYGDYLSIVVFFAVVAYLMNCLLQKRSIRSWNREKSKNQ